MDKAVRYTYGAMKKDFTEETVPSKFYIDGQNIQITANKTAEANGGVVNVKGNSFAFQLPPNQIIIGCTSIRETIILFTTNNQTPQGGEGRVYTFSIDKATNEVSDLELKYLSSELNFTTYHPIEAIGIEESEGIKRVYFVDYFNPIRGFNLEELNLDTPVELLDLFIGSFLSNPIVTDITEDGSLPVGVYEYAYKLTTVDGKETLYSPQSKQIHLVEDSESLDWNTFYNGSNQFDDEGILIDSSKAVRVTIDLSQLPIGFVKFVTLVVVYKTSLTELPTIEEVEQVEASGSSSISIIHSGNEETTVIETPENFYNNIYSFRTSKTLAIKDNQLIAGNIKEESFEVTDWDTTCVRYKIQDGAISNYVDDFGESAIYNNPYNDESGKINGLDPDGEQQDWVDNHQYKWHPSEDYLGGESLDQSISYKFTLQELTGNDEDGLYTVRVPNIADTELSLGDGYDYTLKSFDTFDSPYYRSLFRGYKRGEVYRFGIVFFNDKNTPSFVKYIGDIKFPEVSDTQTEETIAGEDVYNFPIARLVDGDVKLYSMGIEFSVTIPEQYEGIIQSYKIVRVPRSQNNKTRLAQGVINKFYQPLGGEEGIGTWLPLAEMPDIENYYTRGSDPIVEETSTDILETFANDQVENSRLYYVALYSPEISFQFSRPELKNSDYLKTSAILADTRKKNKEGPQHQFSASSAHGWGGPNNVGPTGLTVDYIPLNSDNDRGFITVARSTEAVPDYTDLDHWEKIDLAKYATPTVVSFDIGTTNFATYSFNYGRRGTFDSGSIDQADGQARHGSCLVAVLEDTGTGVFGKSIYDNGNAAVPFKDYRYKAFLMDYVRLLSEQYGGIGPSAIAGNEFYECSAAIKADGSNTFKVFDGDIHVSMFSPMTSLWRNSGTIPSWYEVISFPVETTINTDLNSGRTYFEGTGGFDHDGDGEHEVYRSQETGNLNGDMYVYNPVFSSERMTSPYFSKPIDFLSNTIKDYRVRASEVKFYGEIIDAWSKFPTNQYYDVDPQYGAINKLQNFKDSIIGLQDRGTVGYVINPRASVSTSEGIPVELGTAQGFQDHKYISTTSGSIHQFASVATGKTVYYYDGLNKKMYGVGSDDSITEVKGLNNYLQSNNVGNVELLKEEGGDNPYINSSVHMAYDRPHNEILITVNNKNNIFGIDTPLQEYNQTFPTGTLVYWINNLYVLDFGLSFDETPISEITELLESFATVLAYDFKPEYTLVYNELIGEFTGFYEAVPTLYLSDKTHTLSPDPNSPHQVYLHYNGDYGSFYGDISDSSVTIRVNDAPSLNKILSTLEYKLKAFDGSTLQQGYGLNSIRIQNDYQDSGKIDITDKHRFRRQRVKVPRDGRARFRDTYFDITFYFDNSNNYKMLLLHMIAYYTVQRN